ncbi:MAG: hypothetical protein H5T41_05520 [Methanomassiliicoccales archaeon]|nr:hypothetical protein [Methanomassiliicoccales archaeon]
MTMLSGHYSCPNLLWLEIRHDPLREPDSRSPAHGFHDEKYVGGPMKMRKSKKSKKAGIIGTDDTS